MTAPDTKSGKKCDRSAWYIWAAVSWGVAAACISI